MIVVAPPNFRQVSDLSARSVSPDPRDTSYSDNILRVDLRACEFVHPPAILWSAVYLLLARTRGVNCEPLVPENLGTCVHLKSVGLFRTLQQSGVTVDDRGVPTRHNPQLILPLTQFNTEFEAENLTNEAHEALQKSGMGAPNLYPLVSGTFGEIAMNAVQHSQSPLGGYGLVQFYQSGTARRFVCCVADGGVGIRKSLEQNPELRHRVPYDWVAVELATRERVSGTADKMRGIGLYGVAEDMRVTGRQLVIQSGLGWLIISQRMESQARRTKLFPGTLVYADIPA